MLTNAKITGWRKRTGSDAAGQATFAAQTLAAPVACLRTAVTRAQAEFLATNALAADEVVFFRLDRTGGPAAAAGDRLALDGEARWYEVVKLVAVTKSALTHRQVYVRQL